MRAAPDGRHTSAAARGGPPGGGRAGAAWGTVSGGGPSVTSDAAIAIE
ncbi:hypothetical protein GSH00_25135, partial [Burkholderia pseudomallei]|nr:hypothetical protein [Burkholderia pseudomallei]